MTTQELSFAGSRERVISEEEFLPLVSEAAAGLLALRDEVEAGRRREWSRRFVSRLLREVHTLRTLLNDHDAYENRSYSFLTELVAGVRGFANVIYVLKHLRERFHRSSLRGSFPAEEEFLGETSATTTWCEKTLRKIYAALLAECAELGVDHPPSEPAERVNGSSPPVIRTHLPHNLDEEELRGEGEKVAQVATGFLGVVSDYEALRPSRPLESFPELRDFVLTRLGEEQARKIEAGIHAIQSKYDTYIQYTATEGQAPELRRLRAVISLVLHLFEVTTHLIHFYERHENDISPLTTKKRVAAIVDKAVVLDRAVNYAFRGAAWFTDEGKRLAECLIPAFTSIREVAFSIPEDVRLHIRPAALIAGVVSHHGTPVRMTIGDESCDAGSITDVIFLAGSHSETREISFRGDERPLADLAVLFEVGLGDDGHEAILERLPYLKS